MCNRCTNSQGTSAESPTPAEPHVRPTPAAGPVAVPAPVLSRRHRRPVTLDPAEPQGATLYAFVGAALFDAARFAVEHVSVTVTLF